MPRPYRARSPDRRGSISTLGTDIAGTIMVAGPTADPTQSYAVAMIVLAAVELVGLGATMFRPANRQPSP